MNTNHFQKEQVVLPFDELVLNDDELFIIKGGCGTSPAIGSGGGCGCGCDCGSVDVRTDDSDSATDVAPDSDTGGDFIPCSGSGCGCGCDSKRKRGKRKK